MKQSKSKVLSVKCNSIADKSARNQQTIQKQAEKKYLKFKKSASQPAYFLNQSRLKRISDIYRIASIQKLSKSSKNIKSLYNSLTPQKKNSFHQNISSKKNNLFNTVNMNKLFDTNQKTNQKTKRLVLTRPTQQKQKHDYHFQLKQAIKNYQKLVQISKINMQKSFLGQYLDYCKSLTGKDKQNSIYSQNLGMKQLIFKFANLIQACQKRVWRYQQIQNKLKYQSIQSQISILGIEIKKKQIKIELLNRQMQQLKLKSHAFKNQNKVESSFKNRQKNKVHRAFQINISPNNQNNSKSQNQVKILASEMDKLQSAYFNLQLQSKNKAVQMIAKIRDLQKKQKQLVSVLVLLKKDGVDVEKAYEDIIKVSSQARINSQNQSQTQIFSKLMKELNCIPKQIRRMKNNNSYDGDVSIIQSCDGLSLNGLQQFGIDQNYPIKREYVSKILDDKLKERLKLDFDCLYENSSFEQNYQNSESHSVQKNKIQTFQ